MSGDGRALDVVGNSAEMLHEAALRSGDRVAAAALSGSLRVTRRVSPVLSLLVDVSEQYFEKKMSAVDSFRISGVGWMTGTAASLLVMGSRVGPPWLRIGLAALAGYTVDSYVTESMRQALDVKPVRS